MGHFLSEKNKQRLLSGGKQSFKHEAAEINKCRGKGDRNSARQIIDDPGKQQRRNKRHRYRCRNTKHRTCRKKAVRRHRRAKSRKYALFIFLHAVCLLSDFRKGAGMPEHPP